MTRDEALQILGIPKGAAFDVEEIRKRHRMLIGKIHPDKAGSKGWGGSVGLAASLNSARDFLVEDLAGIKKNGRQKKESDAAKAQREAYERQQRQHREKTRQGSTSNKSAGPQQTPKTKKPAPVKKQHKNPFYLTENRMLFLDYSFRFFLKMAVLAAIIYQVGVNMLGNTPAELAGKFGSASRTGLYVVVNVSKKAGVGIEYWLNPRSRPSVLVCWKPAVFEARKANKNAADYYEFRMMDIKADIKKLRPGNFNEGRSSLVGNWPMEEHSDFWDSDFKVYIHTSPFWYSIEKERKRYAETGKTYRNVLFNGAGMAPLWMVTEREKAECSEGYVGELWKVPEGSRGYKYEKYVSEPAQ